jgi:alpha-beta hydrolase superfamily lysophospholipase
MTGDLVIMPDRRGSGENSVARGDTPNAGRLLADLTDIIGQARLAYGVKRWAVVGVSWGGKLALAWAQRHPRWVARVLLIAPGLFPRVGVNPLKQVAIAASLALGLKNRYAIPLSDPTLFTANPAGQQFIADDPLKVTHATAQLLWASRQLDRRLLRLRPKQLARPTTLLLAGKDRIIRNKKTEKWLRRVAAEAPTVITFPDAHHSLEFEQDRSGFEQLLSAFAKPRSEHESQPVTGTARHAG